MPTNGVGLGHAQRCALIAGALDPERPRPVFAAFPSCMRRIKSQGFDVMPLIGRSPLHAQGHEHDLANYLRLRALCRRGAHAGLRRRIRLRLGLSHRARRRASAASGSAAACGRASQDNSVALDREKAFERVIVPSEAFEELNDALFARRPPACGGSGRAEGDAFAAGQVRPARRPRRAVRTKLRAAGRIASRWRRGGGSRRADPGALRPVRAPLGHASSRGGLAERDAGARLVRLAQVARRSDPARRRACGGGGPRRHRRRVQFVPRGALQPDPGDLPAADRARSWTTSRPAPGPLRTGASRRLWRRTN